MMTPLTEQELHNLAMNVVGEKLQKMGYEFVAINSKLKRHPQYVLFKKNEKTIFVIVKVTQDLDKANDYDVIWMETFVQHAKQQEARVWFAGVGIANAESIDMPVFKDQPYYLAFDEFIKVHE